MNETQHHPAAVAVALGSNLGDRLAALRMAVTALSPFIAIKAVSPIYETAPAYVTDQPAFLNATLTGTTTLSPQALLRALKNVEEKTGRQPTFRYGPRLIDLDLIFYGDEVINTPELTLPHSSLAERTFVLRPLADVAPDWRHPQTGLSVAHMLKRKTGNEESTDMRPLSPILCSLIPKRPLMMGIVNVTPDSFSGDGVMKNEDYVATALDLAQCMAAEGADILDIGGESSRPGAVPISAEEEIRRVVPVIAAIRKHIAVPLPIAVDSIKADVARAAFDAGATIINDISALSHDPAMKTLAADRHSAVVLMHNRSNPEAVSHDAKIGGQYGASASDDIVGDVMRDLAARAKVAEEAGIARHNIILDPGLGFGKTVEQNLALVRHIGQLKQLGYSVLVGPSRKSFIGRALDVRVDDRFEGTAALVAISSFLGADIIRVHDVGFMARVAKLAATLALSG